MNEAVDEVHRFCRREIDSKAIESQATIPQRIFDGLAELGLFGLTLPNSHGGSELPLGQACRIIEAIAMYDRSVAVTLGLHLGLGTHGLVAFGSQLQRDRYLPSLATGKTIAAFSTTESSAGSDLSALQTVARVEGNGLSISGRKIFVTNGRYAQLFTLAVSTPGLGGAERGQSLVLIQRDDAGFEVEAEEHKLGLKASSTTGLLLDGVQVSVDRILGEPGRGSAMLGPILAWGRTLMSAGCCGAAAAALQATMAHVETRKQFGRSLSALPVVQESLALMQAKTLAMRSLVADVAGEPDDVLASRSLAAKVFCSEAAWDVVDTAIQLHGGLGFIEDTGLARILRDLRVTRIFEGANDVLLTHLGTHELMRTTRRSSMVSRLIGNEVQLDETLLGLAKQADTVADDIDAARENLNTRFRVGALRQTQRLHRLGRACMWRDSLDALVSSVAREPSRHVNTCRVLLWLAQREMRRLADEPMDSELIVTAIGEMR